MHEGGHEQRVANEMASEQCQRPGHDVAQLAERTEVQLDRNDANLAEHTTHGRVTGESRLCRHTDARGTLELVLCTKIFTLVTALFAAISSLFAQVVASQ
ncbi:unnamed protein product [Protopolystoma xenopodis]|uniref:Uncharacterized protein n=1 Tax=Protopolystoma xenopodis TaxID=117903 RepID=A0A448X4D1_9PLAT|nr:unnamed protein product [Protopolystoma xenopodis]